MFTNFDSEEYSWSEMEVLMSGVPITTKIRGVEYAIESDDEELFAGGDEAIDIKSGNIKKSGTLKILGVALDAIQASVVAKGGRFITDAKFDLAISYLPGVGRPIKTDVLVVCKISKMPKGWQQGEKFMDCTLPFKFLRFRG